MTLLMATVQRSTEKPLYSQNQPKHCFRQRRPSHGLSGSFFWHVQGFSTKCGSGASWGRWTPSACSQGCSWLHTQTAGGPVSPGCAGANGGVLDLQRYLAGWWLVMSGLHLNVRMQDPSRTLQGSQIIRHSFTWVGGFTNEAEHRRGKEGATELFWLSVNKTAGYIVS